VNPGIRKFTVLGPKRRLSSESEKKRTERLRKENARKGKRGHGEVQKAGSVFFLRRKASEGVLGLRDC